MFLRPPATARSDGGLVGGRVMIPMRIARVCACGTGTETCDSCRRFAEELLRHMAVAVPDDDGVYAVEWKPAELDTGLRRATNQTIGQPTGDQARELDDRLREFDELRLRGEATSHTVYIGGRR